MNQPVTLSGSRRAGILGAMSQGLSQPAPPRVSIKAQRFTLVDAGGVQIPVNLFDAGIGVYLDVVIIGANPNKSKIYYEFEYDPQKDEPPTCFSDNGLAPSAQATVPQSATCAACPNNVWGSDTSRLTNKPTKACSDRKKIAVIVVNDPSQLVYQLQIPPASLKHLAVYANALAAHQVMDSEGARPCDPADVVTRIYFNPAKQGELMFTGQGYREQMAPYTTELIARADASGIIDVVTGAKDVPYQGAIAGPNPSVAALPAPAMQTQAPPPPPAQQFQQPAPQAQVPLPQTNGEFPTQQAPQPQFQQPAPQQPAPQAAPAPRTRRGGARAGAGRPVQQEAPQQAPQPQAAPFQQPAPQAAPQQAPFGGGAAPFAGPTGPAPTPAPAAATTFPSSAPQPAPFQMQAAPPAPSGAPGVPPFLQVANRGLPMEPQQPAFGMTNGAAPDPGLSAALTQAFGAPMQPRLRG